MTFKTTVFLTALAVLTVGITAAPPTAVANGRCFVEYAPGDFYDFSGLFDVRHRDESAIVNYLFDDGNVVRSRYKSSDAALHWIRRVYQQLRECQS